MEVNIASGYVVLDSEFKYKDFQLVVCFIISTIIYFLDIFIFKILLITYYH